jgi:type I restriction enzyme, S subunit
VSAWERVALSDVATSVDYGVTASATEQPLGPKFLRITDIQNGCVDWDRVPWCECDNGAAAGGRLKQGDIVFARTGATTGKSFLIRDCPSDAVFASYLIRVRLGDRADSQYVSHYFRTPDYWAQITASARGVAQPGVNASTLKALRIPLPPMTEQRRIAEVLDRAEVLRAKRRAALAQLDALAQSIFVELFGRHKQTPVTIGDKLEGHPQGWRWELLTDVARLATGHTPDRQRTDYWNGDTPWITLTEIRQFDGTVAHHTAENITKAGIDNSSAVKLPAGTVCFSRTASIGFVTVMGREMATSQDFVNWVCGPRLESTYLMHAFLQSRARLRSLSTGSTHKTIYFPTVEQFRALIPPLHTQREFAQRIAAVEKLKTLHRASLAEIDVLFAALQHCAFRGEL